jgi:hypothetical protein
MGSAHGTEELGLCSHGLACQAGACMAVFGKSKKKWPAKIFCEAHTAVHILTVAILYNLRGRFYIKGAFG